MNVARNAGLSCASAVILAVLVVTVMNWTWRTGGLPIGRWIGVVWHCPGRASDISTEFREMYGGTGKDIPIGSPSPKEEMFFAFRNHFQVFCRKINWGQLESGLRAQHKRESFALWQIVKIQTLTWNGWSERHIPFRRFVLCWSGPAVRPQIIDA